MTAESENIELIRDAFARLEEGRFEELFALADGEIEIEHVGGARSLRGVGEARTALDRWLDRSRRWRAVDLRYLTLGGRVLAVGHVEAEASLGSPLSLPIAWLFTVRDGKVARIEMYANERHARRAVEGHDESAT